MRTHRLNESLLIERGRLTVFREPQPNRSYCIGLDFAEGLDTGDFDAGVVLDEAYQQVAVIVGRWGPMSFLQMLRPLLDWYEPFIVGERQRGLLVLRRLWELGYWVYYARDLSRTHKPIRDRLGHAAVRMDPPVQHLRGLIAPRSPQGNLLPPRILIRDAETHSQLCRFTFRTRSSSGNVETSPDSKLVWGAPPGEHDDLVRALALAAWGVEELPFYEKPPRRYKPGSLGEILDSYSVLEEDPSEREPVSMLDRLARRTSHDTYRQPQLDE